MNVARVLITLVMIFSSLKLVYQSNSEFQFWLRASICTAVILLVQPMSAFIRFVRERWWVVSFCTGGLFLSEKSRAAIMFLGAGITLALACFGKMWHGLVVIVGTVLLSAFLENLAQKKKAAETHRQGLTSYWGVLDAASDRPAPTFVVTEPPPPKEAAPNRMLDKYSVKDWFRQN